MFSEEKSFFLGTSAGEILSGFTFFSQIIVNSMKLPYLRFTMNYLIRAMCCVILHAYEVCLLIVSWDP